MIDKCQLSQIYESLLNNENVLKMKEIPMHRGSNCYLHSFRVARRAIRKALKCKKELDVEALLYACILHDYYLYDWRVDKTKRKHHLSSHPYLAAEQAHRDFGVSEFSMQIITSHMWPINTKDFPRSKEARLLTWSDKAIATREALTSKRFKRKRMDKYYSSIKTLFD